jgi:hypothetical protein
MFQKAELTRLRAQKDLLLLESSLNRLKLAADWQRLRSPEYWAHEAGQTVRRHPVMTAVLGAAAGLFGIQALRRPRPAAAAGGLGRLGRIASLAFTVWKFVRDRKTGGE